MANCPNPNLPIDFSDEPQLLPARRHGDVDGGIVTEFDHFAPLIVYKPAIRLPAGLSHIAINRIGNRYNLQPVEAMLVQHLVIADLVG